MENNCGTSTSWVGRRVELDWLRQMIDWMDSAIAWSSTSAYQRLDAAATGSLEVLWDAHKDENFNGIDH